MFLVSVENGAGVNKMTNMTYAVIVHQFQLLPEFISSFYFMEDKQAERHLASVFFPLMMFTLER